jgi:hypothetical protein
LPDFKNCLRAKTDIKELRIAPNPNKNRAMIVLFVFESNGIPPEKPSAEANKAIHAPMREKQKHIITAPKELYLDFCPMRIIIPATIKTKPHNPINHIGESVEFSGIGIIPNAIDIG